MTLLLSGCIIPKKRGDAWVHDYKDFPFVYVDYLLFPWMKLETGRKYEFQARGLPHRVYPDRLELRYAPDAAGSGKVEHPERPRMSMEEIQRTNQGWRQTKLRIRYRSRNGNVFFDWTGTLEPKRNGPVYEQLRHTAVLQFAPELRQSLAGPTDYDVEVDVLATSPQNPIEGRLFAQEKIY